MASFSIPLTGLKANTTALNTIANNLSNMNTTGYKSKSTSFSDLLYQQIGTSGSGSEVSVGSGVKVASNSTDFSDGTISSTSVSDDAAIDGSGFFVLDNNGSQLYTRDGTFQLSSDGTLETSGGLAVMGYAATKGVVNTSGGLSDITIPTGQVMKPSATTALSMTTNLNSSASVGTSTSASDQTKVYDSLGNSYEATVTYTKTGTNTWSYNVSVPDTLPANSSTSGGVNTVTYNFGSSGSTLATVNAGTNLTITGNTNSGTATIATPTVTSGESIDTYVTALNSALTTAGINGVTVSNTSGKLTISGTNLSTSGSVIQDPVASTSATGTLTFDSTGNLVSPASDVSGISFSGLSDGAANLNLTWDLYGTSGTGNISQTSGTSATSATSQNGYASGEYKSFAIGSDGTVTVTYTNGKAQDVGQLAIATVNNEQGLNSVGSTNYEATTASGSASVGTPGSGGRGKIDGSSLEGSNVSISAEFSNLIIAQRAFEANSKAVTTFDTVTQETINMIH
jgi:flagellar hook protein FlgE